MPRVIVHTTTVTIDGMGDLVYFLNWLKAFHKYYDGVQRQLALIFADDVNAVNKYLISFNKVEPEHPIFNFFNIVGAEVKSALINTFKIAALRKSLAFDFSSDIDLGTLFSQITSKDFVTMFTISVSGYLFFKSVTPKVRVDKELQILEFGAPVAKLNIPDSTSLGLQANEWGLLHDLDGITGNEQIDYYLEKLSPETKRLIFDNDKITIEQAKTQLAKTPTVFAYLSILSEQGVLEAALQTPIIQQAIAEEKVPLFFLTNYHEGFELPPSLKIAAKAGKIRIVNPSWLETAVFNNLNAIFMHHATKSIIIPSGDNTLTACIKAGKFPLYSAKKNLMPINFMPENFLALMGPNKANIFTQMQKILLANAKKYAWDKHSGFNACNIALQHLSNKNYVGVQAYITSDMLAFFKEEFAPYLMDNFAFERKSLPAILEKIKEPVVVANNAPVPANSSALLAQYNNFNKTTVKTSTDTNNNFSGLKAGFLNKKPKGA